jgi:hypothetical protein
MSLPATAVAVVAAAPSTFVGTPARRGTGCGASSSAVPGTSASGVLGLWTWRGWRRDDQTVDAERAETYLRTLAESELRRLASPSARDPRPARVWLAATALIAADGIDAETAQRVLTDLENAAALRPGMPSGGFRIAPGHRLAPVRPQRAAGPAGPGVPLFAVSAGVTLPLLPEHEGWRGEFRLLALVAAGGYAALTVAARWVARAGRPASRRPSHAPFDQVGCVDDQGCSYQASLWDRGLEDGREWWDGHLRLSPAPPPGTRWLDISPQTGGPQARIDLAGPPAPAEVIADFAPPASAAARLLDCAAEALLGAGRSAVMTGVSSRVAQVAQALTESGAVPAGEQALVRLTALADGLGLDLGVPGVAHASVPDAWAGILAAHGACDGPQAVASFAVILPEVDGATFVLAGLRSWREGATLHVLARGWEPSGWGWLAFGGRLDDRPPDPPVSWQARDSTGRWHLVQQMNWGDGDDGTTQIEAYLTPPLHPAATSLEVIITGVSSRVRASVPLDWQTAP